MYIKSAHHDLFFEIHEKQAIQQRLLLCQLTPLIFNLSDAVDNHRSFNDKHGFTGKREIQPDEDIKAGNEILKASIVDFVFYV